MKDRVKKEDTSLAFSFNASQASPAFSDPSVAATLLGLLLRGGFPCLAGLLSSDFLNGLSGFFSFLGALLGLLLHGLPCVAGHFCTLFGSLLTLPPFVVGLFASLLLGILQSVDRALSLVVSYASAAFSDPLSAA